MNFDIYLGELIFCLLILAKSFTFVRFFRKGYWGLLAKLIEKSSLFDSDYYLDCNEDVREENKSAIWHYIVYGEDEGRQPLLLFSPIYYRSRAGRKANRVNLLLHYIYIGRYKNFSPSPWFDINYYLRHNKSVKRFGQEPIRHFLTEGGFNGCSPNSQFDSVFYLSDKPELIQNQINPLVHYINIGRFMSLPTRNTGKNLIPSGSVQKDNHVSALDLLNKLNVNDKSTPPKIDIIIPVYGCRNLTLSCIYHVLTADNETSFELIVVDDHSLDLDLKADLVRLADKGLFTLHVNESNLGYVYSVNFGLNINKDRDVILLNSDTEVYGNWVDRLFVAANRHLYTATVTPLSNNATICSYPRFLHDNPYELELSYSQVDTLTAKVNSGFEVDTPTGVGFCMYIRRDALNDVGQFDEDLFGWGYGEENDFCQRVINNGWRNIIAADVFVRHLGGSSFKGTKDKRIANAMKVLRRRYPDYLRQVNDFISKDPLFEARQRLDWARFTFNRKIQNTLFISHDRGGGSERHLQEDSKATQERGFGVFYLRPERNKPSHVRLSNPFCRQLLNLTTFELKDINTLSGLLKELNITSIHIHGLVDYLADAPNNIVDLAKLMKVPLIIDIHDYETICPRINLVDKSGSYCGEPDEQQCNNCLIARPNDFGVKSISNWRESHRELLQEAESIFVPDVDVATRLSNYYPELRFIVDPHEKLLSTVKVPLQPQLQENERLRIVVIGAISKIKGYDILLKCADDAKKRKLPLDFIVMGYTFNDMLLSQVDVDITGKYLEQDAENTLRALAPHVVWLPSIWPETYSYTLSLAMKLGYSVFAFDIGAISRRLLEVGLGENISPLSELNMPNKINERFIEYRIPHSLKILETERS